MPTLQGKVNDLNKKLSEIEKNLGIDLKLTEDGDIQVSNIQDLDLVVGANNAAQAIRLKLELQPGSLLYHPGLGVNLGIGEKIPDVFFIKNQILKSFAGDKRFENVSAKVDVQSDVIILDLIITLAGTGVAVPLQVAIPK
jgi:hypothetical protein